MEALYEGCLKVIFEKYVEPTVNGIVKITKEEWQKFKIDFDLAFTSYLKNSYEKYGKIKTILYRTEPKNIYDFFEVPILERAQLDYIKINDVNDILDISNFVIIQGTGGIGKSTLMKHLFVSELKKKELIPIFLELKDINEITEKYEMIDLIFEKLDNLGTTFNKEYLDYALKSGCFLFLLDGYDEISSEKKDYFFRKLDAFCDKYSHNYYVISSRPYSEFIEFQRFTILTTCPLKKEQAISLINKVEFDEDIKSRFSKALELELYEKHQSFASNPLLLNIMLLTFDNYAEIPGKLHLFYSNAFETLYSKHDATKAGYRRELRSSLTYDSFKKVFSYFCFMSYSQGKTEFSYEDLIVAFKKIHISKVEFDVDNYIFDLANSLCVLYKEGLNYKFTHRSFQEYFTALFYKELSDDSMRDLAKQVIAKDVFKATHDKVFDMLYDMSEDRFEQNILLPILKELEEECMGNNKYLFYFERILSQMKFDNSYRGDRIVLWISKSVQNDIIEFIFHFGRMYAGRGEIKEKRNQEASDKLLQYLIENKKYEVGKYINIETIKEDEKIYELMKDTWVGEVVAIISQLSVTLKNKQKQIEVNLSNLLL